MALAAGKTMKEAVQKLDTQMPQYRAVRADMLSRIESGEWAKGEAIPPLNDLEEMYPVSRMTVLKALHLLEEEGYLSIEHGRGTFVQREIFSGRVGILCGDDIFSVPPPPFSAAVCQGLKEWLGEAGFEPRIYVVEGYDSEPGEYLNHALGLDIKRGMLQGLALISTNPVPALLDDAEARGLPLIDIGGNLNHPGHVTMDHERMITESLGWLAQRGRRTVGIMCSLDYEREWFRELCSGLGMRCLKGWILDSPPGDGSGVGDGMIEIEAERRGFEFVRRMWEGEPHPDAILVSDDIMAKGASQALLAMGVRCPEETLLMAATNSGVPVFYPIPLARYEFNTAEVVERAGQALLKQIDGETVTSIPPVRGRIVEPNEDIPMRKSE
jgi:DNA-binding LacI/PurR family transcriptional regulator